MISDAAMKDPEWGPRVFLGILLLVPLAVLLNAVRELMRCGLITANQSELKIISKAVFRSKYRWSPSELLTVCVVPSGRELHGFPVEKLAVIDLSGNYAHFFEDCSNSELAWIAHSIRLALNLPEPPAVTQSDPDKAVVEVSRGLIDTHHSTMREAIDEMLDAHLDLKERASDGLAPDVETDLDVEMDVNAVAFEQSREITDKATKYSQARIRSVIAELGLINVHRWQPGSEVSYQHVTLDGRQLFFNSLASTIGYSVIFLFVVPFAIPILGSILVIPVDLIGSKRVHFVIADLMGFGIGLVAWMITLSALAFVWVYLKLDAAFAFREVTLNWRRKELVVRDRHEEQHFTFREIQKIITHEVQCPDQKQSEPIARMEVQLSNQVLPLMEIDESNEPKGLAVKALPSIDQLNLLAHDLATHLRVPVERGEALKDRYSIEGYPRNTRLRDFFRLWRNVSGTTKGVAILVCLLIVLFWTWRFAVRYQANWNV